MGDEAATLSQNFTIIAYMMQSISVFMGVCFTFAGIFQLKKHAETKSAMSQQGGLAGPLLMIIAGAMLLILPEFVGAMAQALMGYRDPMAYTGGPSGYSSLVPPIMMLVRIVGIGSFMRGIVLLARAGGHQAQQGTLGKAIVHIIAGVLCVHIQGTTQLIEQILGMMN